MNANNNIWGWGKDTFEKCAIEYPGIYDDISLINLSHISLVERYLLFAHVQPENCMVIHR